MKRFLLSLACVLAAGFGGQALANDAVFGGEGVNLVPIKNADIEMADEQITLQQTETGWHVNVVFHFKNESSAKQSVTVGFPFQGREVMGGYGDGSWKRGLASNFKSIVRGTEVKTKKVELISEADSNDGLTSEFGDGYTHAYTWPVEFAPGELVEIINSYDIKDTILPGMTYGISYILKTGALWKSGKIGRSQIEMRFIHDVVLCDQLDKYIAPGELNDDMDTPCMVAEKIRPEGYTISGEGKNLKISWDLKAFAPKSDLYVNYMDAFDVLDAKLHQKVCIDDSEECLKTKNCKDLRILRNEYYAMLGYSFKSEDLKKHFAKQSWYKADKDFDLSKLSKPAQEWLFYHVNEVKKLEKALKCK